MKIIPKNKFIRTTLTLALVTIWLFAGWPQIWNFPPRAPKAHAITCDSGALSNVSFTDIGGGVCRGFVTTTGTGQFTLPSDWSDDNQFEVIGGGGAGGTNYVDATAGGGGGAYSSVSDIVSLADNTDYNVGAGGTPSATASVRDGGDSFFGHTVCASANVCAGGGDGATDENDNGAGGAVIVGTGFAGGTGGTGGSNNNDGGGGGGAAGGPNGVGGNGGNNHFNGAGGAGGGDGGQNGANGDSEVNGGAGGDGPVSGGGTPPGGAGTAATGGGGAGGTLGSTENGGNGGTGDGSASGTNWGAGKGSGGGGGGGSDDGEGGDGGLYGGGGGGHGEDGANGEAGKGLGADGVLVITYTPAAAKSDVPYALSINSSNKAEFEFIASDTTYNATGTTNINDNAWHHVVGTYDGNDIKVYVDGVLEETDSSPSGDLPINTGNVRIGTDYQGTPANFFSGQIDEARISSNVLSADWIATEYNNQNEPAKFIMKGGLESRKPSGPSVQFK
jgi:hypothetical protein